MHKKAQILLTGGRGFIGSHTLKLFRRKGYEVRLFSGDIRRVQDWEQAIVGDEVVLHLAGVRAESEKDFSVNTRGTENLLLAMKPGGRVVKKIVYGSTQAVYMGCKPPFTEQMGLKPTTVYGKSKLEAEKVLLRKGKKLGIPVVILRYSVVLGPGIRRKSNMSGPLRHWVEAGLAGKPIKVFQDGKQTRDYVHVEDVAKANLLAARRLPEGIYNVGGGRRISVGDLAKWVREATGKRSRIEITGGEANASDQREMFSDIGKIESFGWRPKKSAQEAVEEYVKKIYSYPRTN